jgi:hypothetical protein
MLSGVGRAPGLGHRAEGVDLGMRSLKPLHVVDGVIALLPDVTWRLP